MTTIPLTGGDLRTLADALDEVEDTPLAASQVILRIEVALPENEDPCGHFVRFDEGDPDLGWGFVPLVDQ
jgi:hypothetical protein